MTENDAGAGWVARLRALPKRFGSTIYDTINALRYHPREQFDAAKREEWIRAADLDALLADRPDPVVCPHCHFPAVLPEVCTPDVNAACNQRLGEDGVLFEAGRQHGIAHPSEPPADTARLLVLAKRTAGRNHAARRGKSGYGPLDRHEGHFLDCPHPDCVLVRAARPPQP